MVAAAAVGPVGWATEVAVAVDCIDILAKFLAGCIVLTDILGFIAFSLQSPGESRQYVCPRFYTARRQHPSSVRADHCYEEIGGINQQPT
jgi:hypothetical protein